MRDFLSSAIVISYYALAGFTAAALIRHDHWIAAFFLVTLMVSACKVKVGKW